MRLLLIHNDYQQLGGETLAFNAELSLLRQSGRRTVEERFTSARHLEGLMGIYRKAIHGETPL